ncbi:MAG: hypothetical protein QXT43_01655 [Candidatus Micrarchaeaceae archaeon]
MIPDNVHMDSRLVIYYMGAAFVYLAIGTLLFAVIVSGAVKSDVDSVFVLWFFGFVVMMVFGLSYMFAPGFSHARYADYRIVASEFAVLNAGIIVFFSGGALGINSIETAGATLMLFGVLVHAYNMLYMLSGKGAIGKLQQA